MATITEHTTQVDGRDVRYYEAGEPHRDTLLLIHGGFGAAYLQWQPFMDLMADEFYLIAADLPGYGGSVPLPQTTIPNLVSWLEQLIDRLGLGRVILAGNAFGGLVARLFAAENPSKVEALILVNGGIIPSIPPVARFLARLPILGSTIYRQVAKTSTRRSDLQSIVHNQELLTDEFVAGIQAERAALARLMQGISAEPIEGKTKPDVPVLLIWGEDDKMTPKGMGETMQRNIPGAQLSLIAECCHMPHVEVPEIFMWQVKNYLKERHRTQLPPKNRKNLNNPNA